MKIYLRSSKYDDYMISQDELDRDDELFHEIITRIGTRGKKLNKSLIAAKEYLCDKYNITFKQSYGGWVTIHMAYDRDTESNRVRNHEFQFNPVQYPDELAKTNIAEQLYKRAIRNKDTYPIHDLFYSGESLSYAEDYAGAHTTGYAPGHKPSYQDDRRKSLNNKLSNDHNFRRKYRMFVKYGEVTNDAGISLADYIDANRDSIQDSKDIEAIANEFDVPYSHVDRYVNFYDTALTNDEIPEYLKR